MHPYGKYGVRLGTELSENYKVLDLGIVWTQIMTAYILYNTTHTGPPRLRYLFRAVQTQTMADYCRILPTLNLHDRNTFFR